MQHQCCIHFSFIYLYTVFFTYLTPLFYIIDNVIQILLLFLQKK